MSGMGRYVDVRPLAAKVVKMAGVVNKCMYCETTVYDDETALKHCPKCDKPSWTHFPNAPEYQKADKRVAPEHLSEYYKQSKPGYHIRVIPEGIVGELSKLLEEVHEAQDAEEQGNPIMVLAELADLYGAMQLYLAKHHPTFTMEDLAKMAEATNRAFLSGRRKRKQSS